MRLLFVGGCERSGTSLAQKLLCLDPRIAGAGEFVYTGRIARLFAAMSADPLPGAEPWATRLEAHFSRDQARAAFQRLLLDLLRPARESGPEVRWVSEKTPSNIFDAEGLALLFPDAKILHVARDGRDVLASHLEVRRRILASGDPAGYVLRLALRRVIARWNAAVAAHRRLSRDPELEARYLLVRYEDLVTEPERTLGRIGDFLGLELDRRALRPEAVRAQDLGLPIDEIWTTGEADRRGFAPERVGRWRRELSAAHRVLASLAMKSGLAELGYPVDGASRQARLGRAPRTRAGR